MKGRSTNQDPVLAFGHEAEFMVGIVLDMGEHIRHPALWSVKGKSWGKLAPSLVEGVTHSENR